MFRRIVSVLIVMVMLFSSLPALASGVVPEERLLEPDVIIAQSKAPYFSHFADIVNVPADAYFGSAPNGKLLVTYYKNTLHFPPSPSYPLGTIEIVESMDNGRTWSTPKELLSYQILQSYGIGTEDAPVDSRDPNLAVLNDGTVLFTFWTSLAATDLLDRNLRLFMMESADGGQTWTIPQEIHSEGLDLYAVKRGNIAVFEDDTVLLPVYGEGTHEGSNVRFIRGVRATSGNWIWYEEVDPFAGLGLSKAELEIIVEVSLVYTGNDTVYAMARETGHVLVSKDRGKTWEIAAVQEPLHQPGLIIVDEKRVFATMARTVNPRYIYGKMFYLDDGLDWNSTDRQLIYTGGASRRDMGDPSAVLTNDNKLLTIYYDTRNRAIAGTFTDLSDWDIPNTFENATPFTIVDDDMEDGTIDDSYGNPWFNINARNSSGAMIREEDGNKYLALSGVYDDGTQSVDITSQDIIGGDVSLTFDFRFNDAVMPESDGLGLSVTFTKGSADDKLPALIRPDALYQYNGADVVKNVNPGLAAGIWYTANLQRLGNRLYVKVAPQGTVMDEMQWNYIYTSDDVGTVWGNLQLAFTAGDGGATKVDIDNIKLLGSYTFSIAEREIIAYAGDEDVQLNLSSTPALDSPPTVVWSSSDHEVVSVSDSGKLGFLKEGTAVITAQVGNISDSIHATVLSAPGELSGIGDSLILFDDNFDGHTADDPYVNADVSLTKSTDDTAVIKSETGNNYLQLSNKGMQNTNDVLLDFEDGIIGQPYEGTYGLQATVEELEVDGIATKAMRVYDTSTTALAEFRTQFTSPPLKRADIDFRLYVEPLKASNKAYIKILHGTLPNAPDLIFWIELEADRGIKYFDGSKYNTVPSNKTITTNKWHDIHIEVFSDEVMGEAHIYIDGVFAGKVLKLSTGSYAINGKNGISNINFLSSSTGLIDESFYIDDLIITDPTKKLTVEYKNTVSGNYAAQYNFRFPEASEGTLITSLLSKRKKNDILLSKNGLAVTDGGIVKRTVSMTLESSEWYSFKGVRIGNSVFAKVWKKGDDEPETWDLAYRDNSFGENDTHFSMSYMANNELADVMDIDNLTLSKSVSLDMNPSRIVSMPNADPVQLALSILPSHASMNVEWDTSDPEVATVDHNGLVSFHSLGTAAVTAKVGNLSISSEIVVEEPATADYAQVDGVIATANSLNEADYTSGSWLYLQRTIAKVVRGKLAVAQAEVDAYADDIQLAVNQLVLVSMPHLNVAKLWASHLNEEDYFADSWKVLKAALRLPEATNVEVVEKTAAILQAIHELADVFPYSIVLNHAQLQLQTDAAPVELKATFNSQLPVDPTITWTSDNPQVVTVNANGVVEVVGPGATLIRAKTAESEAYAIVSVISPLLKAESVDSLQDIRVVRGTARTALSLPDKVWVTLNGGLRYEAVVQWDEGTPVYNPNFQGVYEFAGTLAFQNSIANPAGLVAGVNVIVQTLPANGGEGGTPVPIDPQAPTGGEPQGPQEPAEGKPQDPQEPGGGDPRDPQEPDTDKPDSTRQPIVEFNDTAGHWAVELIEQAVASGIVEGYEDGSFRPDDDVTRAEFIIMLIRALKLDSPGAELKFSDFDKIGQWAEEAVSKALKAGIIEGYEDGSFRPDASITRAEMAVIISRALELSMEMNATTGFADDEEIPPWAKGAIAAVRNLGIVEGRGQNVFAPNGMATRAEALAVLLRMLALK